MDTNGQSLARCIYNCGDDESCETDCVQQFKAKTDDCPCEVCLDMIFKLHEPSTPVINSNLNF